MFSSFKKILQNSNANNIIEPSNNNGALWLGNYKAALDPLFYNKNNISVVINCSKDIPYIFDIISPEKFNIKLLECFRIPVDDSLQEIDFLIMEKYFHIILPSIISKLISENKNILIHCHAGAQRSVAMLTALLYILIDKNLINFEQLPIQNIDDKPQLMRNIIQYIIQKRPRAYRYGLSINFKSSLENYFNIKF